MLSMSRTVATFSEKCHAFRIKCVDAFVSSYSQTPGRSLSLGRGPGCIFCDLPVSSIKPDFTISREIGSWIGCSRCVATRPTASSEDKKSHTVRDD